MLKTQVAGNVVSSRVMVVYPQTSKQDVEKVVNALYKDARYGGNERMRVRPTHITLTVYYN